ncbi:F0F1 ATP synthase subunit B [Cereibacter sphaeroides]|uniref:F0F1 ATP synthase subunit B n=1 Tax=Rhodobacterales TaxID=204455 RepID=UPI000BBE9E1D|nr:MULTISPECIES: F0F1 ATP synthase subunit B [Paracoccaceae]MCE6950012.1 F0F1 ATP synthase subunit B [Cereibacter sphaeroides]
MKKLSILAALAATPAMAATGPFFSLGNTDFIVTISFLAFIGILVYFKVPGLIIRQLDKRALQIRTDLEEARALREEARTILASYDRKQKEVQEQAARIVASAREEAQAAADQAKLDLKASIARRLAAADEQIASAEAGAVRAIREQAINVAVAAAADLLRGQMTAQAASASIDESIRQVEARFH